MDFIVVIPARADSQRLEKKPLAEINGKPMIQHVYEKAVASGAIKAVIATDSNEIAQVSADFGAEVCMTSTDHKTGTERIAEAAEALGYDDDQIIVNLQADEPLMPPSIITQVASDLDIHDSAKVSTICHPIKNIDDLFDPSVVKVVRNERGFAIYFSRAAIPWERDNFAKETKIMGFPHFKHIGIYSYRVGFLQKYLQTLGCDIENSEVLEQLRMIWHGHRVHVSVTDKNIPNGVDTPADLDRVREMFVSN